jgi:hypothetical protein
MKPGTSADVSGIAERTTMQTAFTHFLQETHQRTSDDSAKAFATQSTRGNSIKFHERSEEEIYVLLTQPS